MGRGGDILLSSHLSITDTILFGANSIVYNSQGLPRVNVVRQYFQEFMSQEDIPLLLDGFKAWRDFPEFLLMKEEIFDKESKVRFFAVKCSKRGNDVFARRLNTKTSFLVKGEYQDLNFFNSEDPVEDWKRGKKLKTRLLFVTLTHDSKRCSFHSGWKSISQEFNLWITNLRNRYGRIEVYRALQAFPGQGLAYGYPHLHLVLLFRDYEFDCYPRNGYDHEGRLQLEFRIYDKDELTAQGKWHSFIDVKAISSMRAAVSYLRKHNVNVNYGDRTEAVLNCALSWFYNKHTYSLSKGFRAALSDLIKLLHISKVFSQETLVGGSFLVRVVSLVGVYSMDKLGIEDPSSWFFEVDKRLALDLLEEKMRVEEEIRKQHALSIYSD
jgi:hypothetical protein